MRPLSVKAYACGRCERVHAERDDAAACCCCKKCRTPLPVRALSWHVDECDACMYGERLRYARASVRRSVEALEHDRAKLTRLLKEGRPAKGSVSR